MGATAQGEGSLKSKHCDGDVRRPGKDRALVTASFPLWVEYD